MASIIDETVEIQQFERYILFFDKPKHSKINNMTFYKITIFRVVNGNKLPLIIKSPKGWLRTGLKEFNNEGKITHSMYFSFGKSEEEKDWLTQFKTKIVEPSIKRVVSSGASLLRPELKINSDCFDDEKFAHIKLSHNKDEDGNKTEEIDENGNTMVIFKLMENNLGQCFTSFFKFNGCSEVMEEPLYLQDLIDKKFEGNLKSLLIQFSSIKLLLVFN